MILDLKEICLEKCRDFLKKVRGKEEALVCTAVILVFLSVWIVQFIRYENDFSKQEAAVSNMLSNQGDSTTDETREQLASLEGAEFRDGKGIISISCSGIYEGGVYVFVNGCIEADIRGKDPATLRVNAGDVVLVMGHDLLSEVSVTVTAAIGKIDCSILNKQLTVGNKGKLLAVIKKAENRTDA